MRNQFLVLALACFTVAALGVAALAWLATPGPW